MLRRSLEILGQGSLFFFEGKNDTVCASARPGGSSTRHETWIMLACLQSGDWGRAGRRQLGAPAHARPPAQSTQGAQARVPWCPRAGPARQVLAAYPADRRGPQRARALARAGRDRVPRQQATETAPSHLGPATITAHASSPWCRVAAHSGVAGAHRLSWTGPAPQSAREPGSRRRNRRLSACQ